MDFSSSKRVNGLSGCICTMKNKLGQGSNLPAFGKAIQEILPEGNAQFSTSFLQTGEGVTTPSAQFTAGTAADFAPFDILTNIVLAQN
jgi:hypothetical protein